MMNNLQWVSEICEKIILKIMQWLLDFVDLTMYRIIFIPNNFCWIYFINEDKSNYTNVTLNPSLVVGVVIIPVLGGNVGTSFFNMYLCLLDSLIPPSPSPFTPWLHRCSLSGNYWQPYAWRCCHRDHKSFHIVKLIKHGIY